MRVLVTGGPGFIGRRVVGRFLDAGWDVTSLSLPGEPVPTEWSRPVTMVYGDLRNSADLDRAMEGVDLVIHLAAIVGLAGQYQQQWDVIAGGTRSVCEAAGGRRLVVASSIAVYGTLIQTQVCREDIGHGPWAGAYGWAKQGQELAALEVAEQNGAALTLVRPANVYGLGGASAWGDRLIDGLRASGGAVIGDAERNNAGLVYVENLADAILLAGMRDEAIGRTYNVCDGEPVTWRRFMDDMAKLAGMPMPPAIPLADALAAISANEDPANKIPPKNAALGSMEGLNLVGFDNRIDASRIRAELGWSPGVTYSDALCEMQRVYSGERI